MNVQRNGGQICSVKRVCSRGRKFPEWLRTNRGAGRSENININRCQTTERCTPPQPLPLPKGYWQVTWHDMHKALSSSEGSRIGWVGRKEYGWGGYATRDRSQLHPKWRTWALTGKSCLTFKTPFRSHAGYPLFAYSLWNIYIGIASLVLQPPHPQRHNFFSKWVPPRFIQAFIYYFFSQCECFVKVPTVCFASSLITI